jgi:hypothetical protein
MDLMSTALGLNKSGYFTALPFLPSPNPSRLREERI